MAPAAACPSPSPLGGRCDYCGEDCDCIFDELNVPSCSFEGCPASIIYHQHCVETYLKSIRLDKQRKSGFQCPRGCGKGSLSEKPCPGRITRLHPIHARHDSSKKRRKAKMPETVCAQVPQLTPKKTCSLSKSISLTEEAKDMEKEQEGASTVSKKVGASVLHRALSLPNQSICVDGSATSPGTVIEARLNGIRMKESKSSMYYSAEVDVQTEIQAGQGGRVKNGFNTHGGGKLGRSYAEMASENSSPQNSVSDDDIMEVRNSSFPQDTLTTGKTLASAPVFNAWSSGRPLAEVLLNNSRDGRPQSPGHPLQIQNGSQLPRSQLQCGHPANATSVTGAIEDDDIEARRRRARSKNEKKHLQRAASKLRAKSHQADGAATTSVVEADPDEDKSLVSQGCDQVPTLSSTSVVCGNDLLRPWSHGCVFVLRERKSSLLAKQLEDFGFVDWQATMAVKVCGSDVHMCIDWLLKNGSSISGDMPLGHSQGIVDVSEDLRRLEDLVQMEHFTQEQVESSVIRNGGDIDAALTQLRSSQQCSKLARREESCRFAQMEHGSYFQETPGKHTLGARSLSSLSWESLQIQVDSHCDSNASITRSSSVKSSESDTNFGPFNGGFISDVARYNALIGMEKGHATCDDLKEPSAACHVDTPFYQTVNEPSFSQMTTRTRPGHIDHLSAYVDGLHGNIFHEPTVSTVTSVAAAVLNENFGADEHCIASLVEAMYDESPVTSTVNSTALGGIWSFPSSLGFSTSRSLGAPPGFGPISSSNVFEYKQLNGAPILHSNQSDQLNGEPVMHSYFSFSKSAQTECLDSMRNSDFEQSCTAMNEAEEQEQLLSHLLSQLLT